MNDKTEMTQEAARPKRKFGPSTVARLQVARVSEMGAFLDAQTGNTSDDILLHKTQQTHPVAVGDFVDVFLYLDPKRRLTASMRVPKMKEGQIARLRVINVSRDGAFLDVGAERGIFMPYAGMRGRPQVGEVVWAKLYTDKSGRMGGSTPRCARPRRRRSSRIRTASSRCSRAARDACPTATRHRRRSSATSSRSARRPSSGRSATS